MAATEVGRPFQPWVTHAALGLNLVAWLVDLGLGLRAGGSSFLNGGGPLADAGGLWAPAIAGGEWWRLLTAGFIHLGLIHLSMNLAALAMTGPSLEQALGRWRFAALYLTSLLAGSLGAIVLSPRALTVGASGAIFGLLGAIVVGRRFVRMGLQTGGIVAVLAINLVFTFAVPGISIGGHLGGLAGGLLAGTALFRWNAGPGRIVSLAACLALAAGCAFTALRLAGA